MKLALAFLIAWPAIAAADPLTMTAATHGGQLDLTWTNTTTAPVTMTTHVNAGNLHYDYLTVKLDGGKGVGKRTMHFTEAREKSAPVEATIAPGASLTRTIDLVWWAFHGDNSSLPLGPGTYAVEATWDTGKQSPKVKLTAKTTLTIPAPRETGCKDTGTTGLALLGHQVGKSKQVEIGLYNKDTVTHCVYGYIKTHEIQSDWLTLATGDKTPRTIKLNDNRDKSYPVAIELAPGATAWTTWDLADWSQRHGGKPISGTQWITATYDAGREKDVWHGKITVSFGAALP